MAPLHFSIGFSFVFHCVLLCFLMDSPCFFNAPLHFSIGFSFVFQCVPLCFLMGPLNYSIGFSFVFYWVPLVFLWVPFIILWVSPCFVMDPLHYSIGFPPSFFNGSPHSSIGFSFVFPMCSPLFSNSFPSLFYWVLLRFILGSSLFLTAPLIFL